MTGQIVGNKPNSPPATTPKATAITPDIYLGVVFELKTSELTKTEIGLQPTTPINKIAEYGLECELPGPVPLGELGQNIKLILEELGADPSVLFDNEGNVKAELKELPVIGPVIALILDADITIEEFYLKIPPKPTSAITPSPSPNPSPSPGSAAPPDTLYSVGISAAWDTDAGEGKLFGNLSLKGLYVKVSNLEKAKKITSDEKQLPGETDAKTDAETNKTP
ncbi:MAG: hypothetical protein SFY66_21565 [Oculatellaceae cyanobacterium bins.114]|nr:hypothetical protein [Oculatellaceae cyanobacterium bins.114]